jgi:hypothetical protein
MDEKQHMTIQESFEIDDEDFVAAIKRRYAEYEEIDADWVEKGKLKAVLKWVNTAHGMAFALDQFLRGQPTVYISEDGEFDLV